MAGAVDDRLDDPKMQLERAAEGVVSFAQVVSDSPAYTRYDAKRH